MLEQEELERQLAKADRFDNVEAERDAALQDAAQARQSRDAAAEACSTYNNENATLRAEVASLRAALREKDNSTPTPQSGDLPSHTASLADTPLNLPREKREAIAQALVGYFDPMQVNTNSDEERAEMLADCRHAADCVMPILDIIEAQWRAAHDEHLANWMRADAEVERLRAALQETGGPNNLCPVHGEAYGTCCTREAPDEEN